MRHRTYQYADSPACGEVEFETRTDLHILIILKSLIPFIPEAKLICLFFFSVTISWTL